MTPTTRVGMKKRHMARSLGLVGVLLVVWAFPTVADAQTDTVVYFHTDAIGSVRMTTDASGQVVERYDYAPFGEPWPGNPAADILAFGGNQRDSETTFGYFGARYLASGAGGRFTTVDPGHVGGDLFDTQSWNAYAYARNNPLRFVDPEGTDYDIRIIGGESFTFEGSWADLNRFASGFTFGSSTWSGDITNALGVKVGTYWWIPAQDVFADAVRGVDDGGTLARIGRIPPGQVLGASPFSPPIGRMGTLIGRSFGTMGRVVASPGLKIRGFRGSTVPGHAINQAINRGVSPQTLKAIVDNPTVVLQQTGGRYLYLSTKGAVVLTQEGQVVTAYTASNFLPHISGILRAALGQ